jgi:hypothetical protein
VRLNKLVCTGLVRFVDERREAIRLCGEILQGLSPGLGREDAEAGNGESDPV